MAGPSTQLTLELGAAVGQAVPFSTAQADRAWIALSGRWQVADPVFLRASYQALGARWPSGVQSVGSGDLRLGTRARFLALGPWTGGLDWEVKLPNASNESGLGTDETDFLARGWLAWEKERWILQADTGMAILGDPNQDAAQDDAALVALRGAAALGPVWLDARVDGRLPSPRNPPDVELAAGLSWGPERGRIGLRLEGFAGLTPAAADGGMRLSVALVPGQDGP